MYFHFNSTNSWIRYVKYHLNDKKTITIHIFTIHVWNNQNSSKKYTHIYNEFIIYNIKVYNVYFLHLSFNIFVYNFWFAKLWYLIFYLFKIVICLHFNFTNSWILICKLFLNEIFFLLLSISYLFFFSSFTPSLTSELAPFG